MFQMFVTLYAQYRPYGTGGKYDKQVPKWYSEGPTVYQER